MIFHWLHGLVIVASLVAALMGALVLATRPDRRQNRLLALLLIGHGVGLFLSRGVFGMAESVRFSHAALLAYYLWVPFHIWLYPAFTGTLDTPLSAPFRTRGFLRYGWLIAIPTAFLLLWKPSWWMATYTPVNLPYLTYLPSFGWLGNLLQPSAFIVNGLGLIMAASAYRRAQGGAKPSARAYLIAFAGYDIGWLVTLSVWLATRTDPAFLELNSTLQVVGPVLLTLWLTAWLAYGILRTQLFDIDLKLKVGISRTTVAAIIAGAAFLGSELIEQSFDVNQTLPAVAIAGLVALAFRPLTSIGNRIADRLMPTVEDTEDYRGRRGHELYEAAVHDAAVDGVISDRERAILDGLARNLGLTAAAARRIEQGVT